MVCISVPYGTSLWQVGNSKQQKRSYKIVRAREKKKFLDRKLNCYIDPPTLTPEYMMHLVIMRRRNYHSLGFVIT